MAQRSGRSLLGWVNGVDLKPLFLSAAVDFPGGYDSFKVLYRAAQGRAAALPPVGQLDPTLIGPLPDGVAQFAAELVESELYSQNYDQFEPAAQLASVPLANLLTPQWWADSDYVQELAKHAPAVGDDDGVFSFCFPIGRLGRPVAYGNFGNLVEFVGRRKDIGIPGPIVVERYTGTKVHLGFDVMVRPNFVFVAYVQDVSRLVVLNGVHHLAALARAGHDRAYCVLRAVPNLGEVGFDFGRPEIFKPNRFAAPRPPLITDYFDSNVGDDISIRAMDQRLRISLNFELGSVLQVEDSPDIPAVLT